jgi:O-antigen/teichoic acid export membrane protein
VTAEPPPEAAAAAPASHAQAVLAGATLQLVGHGVALVVTAASTIVLTRFLGPAGYGEFTVLTVLLLVGLSVADFGLNTTAVRTFARDERSHAEFRELLGLRVAISLAVALASVGAFWLLPYSGGAKVASLFVAAAIVIGSVNLTLVTVFQARLDFRLPVALDVISRSLLLAGYLVVAAVAAGGTGERLVLVAAASPVAVAAALVVGLVFLHRARVPVGLAVDADRWRALLRTAAPLAIVGIGGLISYRLDAIVLSLLRPDEDVGIYGLAYRFVEAALPLGIFVVAAAFPVLARRHGVDEERRRNQVQRTSDLLLVLALPITVGAVVLAPDLVRVFGGAEYADATTPLRLLALSLPFTFTAMLLSYVLIAEDLQRTLVPIVLIGLTANLALNIALVPTWSYTASAAITLATEAGGMALMLVVARRRLGRTAAFRPATGILLAAAAMFGVAWLLAGVNALLAVVVSGALYAALVLALRVVTADELRALARRA